MSHQLAEQAGLVRRFLYRAESASKNDPEVVSAAARLRAWLNRLVDEDSAAAQRAIARRRNRALYRMEQESARG